MIKFYPDSKFFDTNDLRLHYLEWGRQDKQPILLLHGFMGHAHVWDEFCLEFRDDYHIISLDQRGHGDSGHSTNLAYGIGDHFTDITRLVEFLGFDSMILIGHSMGGRNALFYTACHPEKVGRLVVVDSRLFATEISSRAFLQLLSGFPLKAEALEEVAEAIKELYPILPQWVARDIAKHGYKRIEREGYVPKYDIVMALQCQKSNFSFENLLPFLKNIICPTLLIRGENSSFLSKEDAAKFVDYLPDGNLKEIKHSTHMPAQENPGEFKKVIWEFLKSGK